MISSTNWRGKIYEPVSPMSIKVHSVTKTALNEMAEKLQSVILEAQNAALKSRRLLSK